MERDHIIKFFYNKINIYDARKKAHAQEQQIYAVD